MRFERTCRVIGSGMSLVHFWALLTVAGIAAVVALVALRTTDAQAQAAQSAEWRWFGSDAGATRYSPLSQIRAENVGKLAVAWRWSARNNGTQPPTQMQVSPITIDGVLYTTAGNQRDVVAIDAATGETLWLWRPGPNERRWGNIIEPVARSAGRGVSYWTDGAGDKRIFVVTPELPVGGPGCANREADREIRCGRCRGHGRESALGSSGPARTRRAGYRTPRRPRFSATSWWHRSPATPAASPRGPLPMKCGR